MKVLQVYSPLYIASMPLESDIKINATKFAPEAILEDTKAFNANALEIQKHNPKWEEVGRMSLRRVNAA